jgi:phosphotransacetylase
MLKSFSEIIEKAKSGEPRPIAVSDAAGESVIEALKEASAMNIVLPMLVGNPEKIDKLAKAQGLTRYEIIPAESPVEIAEKTVELVREGKAKMMMKGKLPTPTLLKAVLDKERDSVRTSFYLMLLLWRLAVIRSLCLLPMAVWLFARLSNKRLTFLPMPRVWHMVWALKNQGSGTLCN